MLKKTLRTNYQRKLARPLTLADGTQLVTLRDAANGLLDAANVRSGGLDNAIRLLLTATETGKRADIVAATDAVERVLRDRRLTGGRSSGLPPVRLRTYAAAYAGRKCSMSDSVGPGFQKDSLRLPPCSSMLAVQGCQLTPRGRPTGGRPYVR
jgi:hypothetical protein